jgi:hypothetical protein
LANESKFARLILAGWLPLLRSAFDQIGRRALYYRMSLSVFLLMLASWVGYFWLGYQLGKGCSDIGRKQDNEDLERRYKILTVEPVEVSERSRDAA